MSPASDSTLADPQQIIADLRRELADLRRSLDEALHEREEALQRETAAAEVLEVINSSPGDLNPRSSTRCWKRQPASAKHRMGILRTWDGERFHLVAAHGDEALSPRISRSSSRRHSSWSSI
jgi:hypothetical protein